MSEHLAIPSQSNQGAAANEQSPGEHLSTTDIDNELLQCLPIQRKLSIGAVDDPLEHEADAMADKVMRMPETNFIQRKCAHCEEEDKEKETIQRKPLTSFIQKKGKEGGTIAAESVSARIKASQGNGSAMNDGTKTFMENRFGANFSHINIHTGQEAIQMSRDLNAKAFTVGNDIYFNEGQYQPGSPDGKHLLAHELTHTIQQTGTIERKIQRRWDKPGTHCPDVPKDKWLESVVVQQEIPQFVTLNWSDGTNETGMCSTGKGHCCTKTSDEVACDAKTSKKDGTNCTPITTGTGFTITSRHLDNNGWKFWNTFDENRAIALHQHHTVKGEPLSHGCVRLEENTARRIFCGAKKGKTRVQVLGFARPACNSSNLQAEWLDDINYVQLPSDGDKALARGISQVKATLRSAFDLKNNKQLTDLIGGLNAGNIAANIPHCGSSSPVAIPANSTAEESRVFTESINVNQFELIFAAEIIAFINALSNAADLSAAQTLVAATGQTLWDRAIARAQTGINKLPANIDDRPLYWTRLRMNEEIRRFTAKFAITDAERQRLIDVFEKSSRGETSVNFSGAAAGQKRILISGFDPFGLTGKPSGTGTNMTILDSNPSGAAVLALDGTSTSGKNGLSAFVQGVIFPVRYRDFDAGMIESLFRPFIDGTTPVSMIMTISQGGSTFDIEEWAGRRRSTSGFDDNEGATSGGSTLNPVEPPGIATGPEFLKTQLPHKEMSTVPQTSLNTAGKTSLAKNPGISVSGTGGGFLSNEIFYRVRLLQTTIGGKALKLPVGHLHVPSEDTTGMSRETIKNRIQEIIAAALPAL